MLEINSAGMYSALSVCVHIRFFFSPLTIISCPPPLPKIVQGIVSEQQQKCI